MLSFFRTNQASASLLLLLYGLILQLPNFLSPPVGTPEENICGFWGASLTDLVERSVFLDFFVPVFLLTVVGIVTNAWVARRRQSRATTQFPGLFVLLCWAMVPAFRSFHPVQVGMLCLVIALVTISRLYKRDDPSVINFNIGAWVALASLFYPPLLLLLPLFFVAMGILSTPTFRSLLQLTTGTLVIFFLVFVYAYWTEQAGVFLVRQFSLVGIPALEIGRPESLWGVSVLALLLVVGIVAFGNTVRLLNIEGTKNVKVVYWMLLLTLLPVFLAKVSDLASAQLVALPLGMVTGLWMARISGKRAEVIHLFLFAAALGFSCLRYLT